MTPAKDPKQAPFGNGPIDLGEVAGVAGPKTRIFDVAGPGWPPGSPGKSEPYDLRRSASF